MNEPQTITIDNVKYVREDSIKSHANAAKMDGMTYVIVRSYDAGVFAGYLKTPHSINDIVTLVNARRLWRWSGAASLSQLCVDGVDVDNCKFPCEVPWIEIHRVCEILPVTEVAKESINAVSVWAV